MDIEKVASETPKKIIKNKVEFKTEINQREINKIISIFDFNKEQKKMHLN